MTLSIAQISVIMLGGGLGALMRFLLSNAITNGFGNAFPYGTLTVNVLGSFVMGLLAVLLMERMQLDPLIRLGVFVGFLGAFTTFSTFSMETMNLFEQGQIIRALLNMLLSVILSVFAVWLGVILGKQLS
ncbi:MAG: fluoride efflux transporter CrcB [Cocleimonas sp.]